MVRVKRLAGIALSLLLIVSLTGCFFSQEQVTAGNDTMEFGAATLTSDDGSVDITVYPGNSTIDFAANATVGDGSTILIGLPGDPETIAAFANDTTSSGVLDEIVVTDEGGIGISWTTGEIYIDGNAGMILETDAAGNTSCTDDALNYLFGNVTGGSTLYLATSLPADPFALVARIYTYNGLIEYLLVEPTLKLESEITHESLDDLHSQLVESGCLVVADANATNANDFTIDAGSYYLHAHDKIDIPTLYSSGVSRLANDTFTYYHVAGVWTQDVSNGVNFAQYDDGTDLVNTNPGKWYSATILVAGVSEIEYVNAQGEHSTAQSALNAAIVYPPLHEGYTVPLAKFVYKSGETAFGSNALLVDARPFHGAASAAGAAIQDLWYTIDSDAGSTTPNSATDTLTIAGGTDISTAVAGDTVTVTYTGGGGGGEGANDTIWNSGNTTNVTAHANDTVVARVDGTTALEIASSGIISYPNQSGAKAYIETSAQSIPDVTKTLINFNTEAYDVQSEFNLTNDRFVALEPGYYIVVLKTLLQSMADGDYCLTYIELNGGATTAVSVINYSSKTSMGIDMIVTAIVYLDGASDYITCSLYHNNAANVNKDLWFGENYTNVTIFKLV